MITQRHTAANGKAGERLATAKPATDRGGEEDTATGEHNQGRHSCYQKRCEAADQNKTPRFQSEPDAGLTLLEAGRKRL